MVQMGVEESDDAIHLREQIRRGRRDQLLQLVQMYGELIVFGLECGDRVRQLGVSLEKRREDAARLTAVVVVQALAQGQTVDAESRADARSTGGLDFLADQGELASEGGVDDLQRVAERTAAARRRTGLRFQSDDRDGACRPGLVVAPPRL